MQNNNQRFPPPKMSSETTHSRFPSTRNTNPFNAFNRSKRYDDMDRRSPPPINTRAAALLDKSPTNNERRNPFECTKNSRFANLCNDGESSPFSRDREPVKRQGNRFRGDHSNYFSRRSTLAKKSPFSLKQDEFPSLGARKKLQ